MDPLPYTARMAGGNDGVVVDFSGPNAVRLTIPGGIEVVLKVGFYKTWLVWSLSGAYVALPSIFFPPAC